MHARLTLAIGAIGASLAFAGPALAASGHLPRRPHQLLESPRLPSALTQPTSSRSTPITTATTTSSTLYVNAATGNDSGTCTKTQPCATIQYAINQAPSIGKIYVSAGSYPEELTIDGKSLAIIGAGKTRTFIDPTTLSGSGLFGAVTFENGQSSRLSDVTVDTTRVSASSCPDGVVFSGESGELTSSAVAVTSQANASFSCGETGVISTNSDLGTVNFFEMSATTVSDYGSDGVVCDGNSNDCTITGSVITGYGPTSSGQQTGIYLLEAEAAIVSGDRVSGNVYTSPQFTGSNFGDIEPGFGLLAQVVGSLTVSRDTLTGNDVGLSGDHNTGPWTIASNTITHATNATGSAPDSAPVPDGNRVGDGLDLDGVDGANVYGNTITSNAGRGINLIGVTNSSFGTSAGGTANTVSHNGDHGIALTTYNEGQEVSGGTSSGNTFSGNVIDANSDDGIFAAGGDDSFGNPVQENNTFSNNTIQGNLRWDALDRSTGSGSDGTANTWTSNTCNTGSPAGICASGAS